jgi:anti-sigma-K factor RskA
LAPLPSGKVYQFWLIKGDTPVSAGLFSVDTQGRGLLSVSTSEPIGSFDAIGVSIEPEGGSPQPTGDIVMLSKLSGS